VVLEGQGGLGKTTLAIHYARTHDDDYPGGVFWAVAGDALSLAQDLTALAPSLGIEIGGLAPIPAGKAILAEIAQREGRWLFIYDNVEDHAAIAGLAPGGDAHLIVTTRSAGGWPGFERMRPGTLPTGAPGDAGPRLLMDEARQHDDRDGARALSEALGGLPLALVVAGALIRRTTPIPSSAR
jgi:hypothetical protein